MRVQHTHPAAVRKTPFSLVELLTVMVIGALLLGITVPVVIKLTSSSSVSAAGRIVGASLRLARQEAIVRRRYVAVLLPADQGTDPERKFTALRACYVTKSSGSPTTYTFSAWVPNTKWELLPTGAVAWELDTLKAISNTDATSGDFVVLDVPEPAPEDYRAIVFAPTGRVAGSDKFLHLKEGFFEASPRPRAKNADNWVEIKVDTYTGRVTFYTPENPPP